MSLDSGWFSLLGAIVGGGIGFSGNWYNNVLARRRDAAAALHSAFASELGFMRLSNPSADDIKARLEAAFEKHAEAVETFRQYVKAEELPAYDEAWRTYCEESGSVRFFAYYMAVTLEKGKALFISRAAHILEFAKRG